MIDENNQEEVVDEIPEVPEVKDGEEDTTDYKELFLKTQGMSKRFQTKLKKLADAAKEPKVKPEVKKEEPVAEKGEKKEILDRIDRAVLSVKGITEPEEIELVEKRKAETGRGLEDLLSANWFKQELKEFRESATSFDAMPKGSKRTNQAARDSVEYWIQKGELPPRNQTELRRKVVNAKMKKQKEGNIFSDQPIV